MSTSASATEVGKPKGAAPQPNFLLHRAAETPATPNTNYLQFIRLGLWGLAVGLGGFLLWASLAPLDEGIPASGVVVVESNRKRIDHLNGGVIDKILVRDGQRVNAGDDLLVLSETQALSSLNATLSQWITALATRARLSAERDGAAEIIFPPALLGTATKEAAELIRAQENLFQTRRQAIQGELRMISESVRGLEAQLASLSKLKAGREKQVALFNEQLQSFQKLRSQGFVSRNYLLEIERQLAEVQSRQSEDLSNIASIGVRLSELRMQGAQREVEYRRDLETQLTEVQRDVATLSEKLSAQRDTVNRLAIKAPVSGTVVGLAFHTIGGVVKPGERILEIVPQEDELVVEAKVPPQYIDRLHTGLPADVHFDAYASRMQRPVINGRVETISADALNDQRTGASYYTMRVTVPGQEVRKLGDLKLQPGMQATVMVKTGERSLITYLLHPLMRRFSAAMSE